MMSCYRLVTKTSGSISLYNIVLWYKYEVNYIIATGVMSKSVMFRSVYRGNI